GAQRQAHQGSKAHGCEADAQGQPDNGHQVTIKTNEQTKGGHKGSVQIMHGIVGIAGDGLAVFTPSSATVSAWKSGSRYGRISGVCALGATVSAQGVFALPRQGESRDGGPGVSLKPLTLTLSRGER